MTAGILIIDKDTAFRNILYQRFRGENYRVFDAVEFSEIKRILRRKRIDVVIINLVELQNEGIHLLKRIKKRQPLIQVILINNSENMTLSIKAMNLGAFDDILLPVNIQSLICTVHDAVNKKRQLMKNRKTFQQKYDDIMMAISFAEAGEAEIAEKILDSSRQPDFKKKSNK